MVWTGVYTDEAAILERLQGRLQIESSSGGAGPIVPVISDELLEVLGDNAEAYITSTLAALNYVVPLSLSDPGTAGLLEDVASKQIIYELFLSAPEVKNVCSCKNADDSIEQITEDFKVSLDEFCRLIQDCKLRLIGETRSPDPCALAAENTLSKQPSAGALAVSRNSPSEPENRLFSHDVYGEDYYFRYHR